LLPGVRRRINRGIARLAAGDPSVDIRKLSGSDSERRLRVGVWRVVYEQIGAIILIAKIDRRDDVYRK
jgi:mRNA-degrading endonuclease RelE of RelBE toxin-antitoxin system